MTIRSIPRIEIKVDKGEIYRASWRELRNLIFRSGTPQDGKRELLAWAKAKNYTVMGFSYLADPDDAISIRLHQKTPEAE